MVIFQKQYRTTNYHERQPISSLFEICKTYCWLSAGGCYRPLHKKQRFERETSKIHIADSKTKFTKLSHGTAVLMVDSKTTFCQELHISTPFDSRPFKQLDYLNFIYFNGNVSIKPSKNLQGSFKIFCQTHLGLCLTKKFTWDTATRTFKEPWKFKLWYSPTTEEIPGWKIIQVSVLGRAAFLWRKIIVSSQAQERRVSYAWFQQN